MAKDRARALGADHTSKSLVDAVHRMEPELQQLAGVLATLSIFGEAGDSIEPVALAALARSMEGSVDELTICWRQLLETVAKKSRIEAASLNLPLDLLGKGSVAVRRRRMERKGLFAVEVLKPARMRAFVGTGAGWFGASTEGEPA